MRLLSPRLASALLLATPLALGAQALTPATRLARAVDAQGYRAHLEFLASDLLEGRGVGTRGDLLAREYIATELESYGVKPEMEIFDSGNLWFAKQLVAEGLIDDPPLFQLCLGIPWGAPYDSETMAYQKSQLPANAVWAAFGIGRNEFPAVAQAVLLGGHVRVGLEDNLWLEKGVYASNGTLVEKAVKIIEILGTKVASPDEGREILKLKPRK